MAEVNSGDANMIPYPVRAIAYDAKRAAADILALTPIIPYYSPDPPPAELRPVLDSLTYYAA